MRKLSHLFMTLSALCFAMPAFAQGGGTSEATGSPSPPDSRWRSRPQSAALPKARPSPPPPKSLARNPAARPGIQFALILGLVLIESLALVHTGDHLLEGEVEQER